MRRFEPGPSGVGPNWATATVLFHTILSRPRCPMKYDDHSRFCNKHLQKGFNLIRSTTCQDQKIKRFYYNAFI